MMKPKKRKKKNGESHYKLCEYELHLHLRLYQQFVNDITDWLMRNNVLELLVTTILCKIIYYYKKKYISRHIRYNLINGRLYKMCCGNKMVYLYLFCAHLRKISYSHIVFFLTP